MIDVKKSAYQEIIEPKNLAEFLAETKNIALRNDVKTAFGYSRTLEQKMAGLKEVDGTYLRILAILKWVALPLLADHEAIRLIEKYFDIPLNYEIEPLDKLKLFLLLLPFDHQVALKEKMAKAFEQSLIEITDQPIYISDESEKRPSIKNWLADYRYHVTSKPADEITLARSEYYAHNKNFYRLSQKLKDQLKIVFDFYDFLLTSPLLAGAFTEDIIIRWPDGSTSLIDDGNIYKTYEPAPAKPQAEKPFVSLSPAIQGLRQDIIKSYSGSDSAIQKIDMEMSQLKPMADAIRLREEFFSAVQEKNVFRTLACVYLMIERKEFHRFLQEDEKLKKFLSAVWEEKYGQAAAENFFAHPHAPRCVQMFLAYVLEDRLGLEPWEAARFGAQIGNLFKRAGMNEYARLAYFDMEHKEFKWLTP